MKFNFKLSKSQLEKIKNLKHSCDYLLHLPVTYMANNSVLEILSIMTQITATFNTDWKDLTGYLKALSDVESVEVDSIKEYQDFCKSLYAIETKLEVLLQYVKDESARISISQQFTFLNVKESLFSVEGDYHFLISNASSMHEVIARSVTTVSITIKKDAAGRRKVLLNQQASSLREVMWQLRGKIGKQL
jgi:hypothetical protein